VKSQKRFSNSLLPGLRALEDLPKVARRILVYGGTRKLRASNQIDVWTVEDLANALADDTLWP
jgi:hypothetical protein